MHQRLNQRNKSHFFKMTRLFNDKNDWIELQGAMLESVSWKEAVARKYRIEPHRVDKAIEAWITHFATQGEEYVALNRAKAWCSNWIGKQLEMQAKQIVKPKEPEPPYFKKVKFDERGKPYTE